jgi:hypothetical protein
MERLLLRCASATDRCPDAEALKASVRRVANDMPYADLDGPLIDACAKAMARADELQRLHSIARTVGQP